MPPRIIWRTAANYGVSLFATYIFVLAPIAAADFEVSFRGCAKLLPEDAQLLLEAADQVDDTPQRPASSLPIARIRCSALVVEATRIKYGGPHSVMDPDNVDRALERSYPRGPRR